MMKKISVVLLITLCSLNVAGQSDSLTYREFRQAMIHMQPVRQGFCAYIVEDPVFVPSVILVGAFLANTLLISYSASEFPPVSSAVVARRMAMVYAGGAVLSLSVFTRNQYRLKSLSLHKRR